MRKVVLCCIAFLLIYGCAAASAEDALILAPDTLQSGDPAAESLSIGDFAADREAVYVVVNLETREQLYRYVPGEESPTLLYEADSIYSLPFKPGKSLSPHDEDTIAFLFGGAEGVYAVNGFTGRLGRVNADGLAWTGVRLDLPYAGEAAETLLTEKTIDGKLLQDGRLLLAIRSDDYTETELYAFDLADGSRTLAGTYPATDKLSGYRDGQVLTLRTDTEQEAVVISALRLDTGEETPLYTVPDPLGYEAAGLVWVEDEDTCYCTISSRVVRLRPDGEPTTMAYVSGAFYSNYYGDAAVLNGHYALRTYDGVLVRQLSEAAGALLPVTLANDDMQEDMLPFLREHPEIPTQIHRGDLYTSSDIAQSIAAYADGIDLFSTDTYSMAADRLKRKGYMADLSDVTPVQKLAEDAYPVVAQAFCGEDGQALAVPTTVSINAWSFNRPLWEQSYPGMEPPETWIEFLTLLLDFEQNRDPSPAYTLYGTSATPAALADLVYRSFVLHCQREGMPPDFTDPRFTDCMALIATFPERELTPDERNELYNAPAIYSSSYRVLHTLSTPVQMPEGGEPVFLSPLPYPVFGAGDAPLVPFSLTLDFLSAEAPNPAGGKEILGYLAGHLEPEIAYTISPVPQGAVENPRYQQLITQREGRLARLRDQLAVAAPEDAGALSDLVAEGEAELAWFQESWQWAVTEEALAAYREVLAPHLYPGASPFLGYDGGESASDMMGEIMRRFLEGHLTLDAMANEMTGKARMILLEGE